MLKKKLVMFFSIIYPDKNNFLYLESENGLDPNITDIADISHNPDKKYLYYFLKT